MIQHVHGQDMKGIWQMKQLLYNTLAVNNRTRKILKRMLNSRLWLSSDSKLEKSHDDLQSQGSSGPDWELL
ncbi:hypothetical protein IEQ34_021714 [Dendrobium chrysotoxum]|uniref:Uncharacterized protein n=1 Tax=Dendrobium chrysotoxum TaxID=161865 RepID=A0AAV7G695_DENCH|nr:hypothetical protein IEQ34_021714 [Dendrobium chrysotoxum]